MPENAPTCDAPRPFRPATPMRTESLAPMTRPDDLVPPMAKPAPMPAATERPRNWRRFRCDIDPLLMLREEFGRRRRDWGLIMNERSDNSHELSARVSILPGGEIIKSFGLRAGPGPE